MLTSVLKSAIIVGHKEKEKKELEEYFGEGFAGSAPSWHKSSPLDEFRDAAWILSHYINYFFERK